MKKKLSLFVVSLLILVFAIGCSDQGKQNVNKEKNDDYPTKDITLVVPFSAGDTADLLGRSFATFASDALGKNIIVQNKTGAGGSIAHGEVSRLSADGYSILLGSSGALTISPYMRDVGYTYSDFEPIGLISENPIAIVVNKDSEFDTIDDFIKYAVENPATLDYGTAGAGVPQHIMMEEMAEENNIKITHIPHEGGNNALAALLGGHIDAAVIGANVIGEQVKSGELKALGVTMPFTVLPEIQTFEEQGYNIVATTWFGIFAPAGLPTGVKDKLAETVKAALDDEKVIEAWEKFNVNPEYLDPEGLSKRLENDSQKNKEIIEKVGLSSAKKE